MQFKEEVNDEEVVNNVTVEVELGELRAIAPSLWHLEVPEGKTNSKSDKFNCDWNVEDSDLSMVAEECKVDKED